MPGFPRKNDEDRTRRNIPRYNKVQPRWDGITRGPDLREGFHEDVVRWWNVWRNSPQAMVMTETDWEQMLDTAVLKEMFVNPSAKSGAVSMTQLASEIRRREDAYGASFEARLKLAMEIQSPYHDAGKEAEIDDAADEAIGYLEELTKAVADKKK